MRYFRLIAAFGCQLAMASALQAHDPGLSSVELELAERGVQATVTFARADAASLVQLVGPSNELHIVRYIREGTSSGEERRAAHAALAKLGPLLELEVDGRAVPARSIQVSSDETNVRLTLAFDTGAAARLAVRSGAVAVLPRGHRQYLSLREPSGRVVADRLLEARADRFETAVDAAWKSGPSPFRRFVVLGIEHILTGWDHLVFLVGLLLAGTRARTALRIITSFTVAHSITLGLGALGIVAIPSRVVEPAIALSIVYIGLENIFSRNLERRWLLTFGFGLAHGFGFASALRDLNIGSGPDGVVVPLVSFNLGVELGQIAIAVLLLPLVWQLRRRSAFVTRWVPACSILIALAGVYWFIERVIF